MLMSLLIAIDIVIDVEHAGLRKVWLDAYVRLAAYCGRYRTRSGS